MKIAITHPTTFTRARRGTERFIHELATFLGRRGHDVTVISCKPGPRCIYEFDGYKEDSHRRLWFPPLARLGVIEAYPFLLSTLRELLVTRYDVVQCCSFTDAFAAHLAGKVTGVPYVFLVNGLQPPVKYFRSLTLNGSVYTKAVQGATEVIAISDYVQKYIQERFGRSGVRIPVPVDTDQFRLVEERRQGKPVILCTSALDDARKGGRVLVRAFDRLKDLRPDVELHISCTLSQQIQDMLMGHISPRWRQDVHFLGAGKKGDLPGLYGSASVLVIPSLWEAFGMVIIESMATGTPVVGTRDGAIPELVNNVFVGRLFDPGETTIAEPVNVEGLVHALMEGLDLALRPETPLNCRRHAEQFSWQRIGPRYEELFERVAGFNKSE